ncbi:MAG: DUF190 domain-containing protein [Pseudomonadota bacterium]
MNTAQVTVVRLYITDGEAQLNKVLSLLRTQEHVRGVTVFRGIAGFGPSGKMHASVPPELSLQLPLVIEYFDTPAKVESTLNHVGALIKPGHVVYWNAQTNL